MAAITVPSRQYVGSARPSTLTASLDSSSMGPVQCDSLAGWPSGIGYDEFVVTIGRGTPTEERILCSSTSGNNLIVKQRGWDDTLAVSHEIGESVEHTISATDMQDANDHITATAAHGSDGTIVGENRLAEVLDATDLIPPGLIAPYAGGNPPPGWMLCDGATLSQATYPKLYAALGTRYGDGGAGTFKVPNLLGKSVFGYQSGDASFGTLGGPGGAKSVSVALVEANLPQHQHSTPALSHSVTASPVGDHTHGITVSAGSASHNHSIGDHTHTVVSQASSEWIPDGTASDFRRDGGGNGSTRATYKALSSLGTAQAAGATATSTSDPSHGHGASSAGAGGHTPSVSVGGHAGGATGGGNGTGAPFSVATLPPFMALNWIIKFDQAAVTVMEAAE